MDAQMRRELVQEQERHTKEIGIRLQALHSYGPSRGQDYFSPGDRETLIRLENAVQHEREEHERIVASIKYAASNREAQRIWEANERNQSVLVSPEVKALIEEKAKNLLMDENFLESALENLKKRKEAKNKEAEEILDAIRNTEKYAKEHNGLTVWACPIRLTFSNGPLGKMCYTRPVKNWQRYDAFDMVKFELTKIIKELKGWRMPTFNDLRTLRGYTNPYYEAASGGYVNFSIGKFMHCDGFCFWLDDGDIGILPMDKSNPDYVSRPSGNIYANLLLIKK